MITKPLEIQKKRHLHTASKREPKLAAFFLYQLNIKIEHSRHCNSTGILIISTSLLTDKSYPHQEEATTKQTYIAMYNCVILTYYVALCLHQTYATLCPSV